MRMPGNEIWARRERENESKRVRAIEGEEERERERDREKRNKHDSQFTEDCSKLSFVWKPRIYFSQVLML